MSDTQSIPAVLVTTAVDSQAAATTIASALVDERLAACFQVASPLTSTYRWRGAVETAQEWVVQAKTTPARLDAVMTRIRELHPYELPEILALPVMAGDPAYLAWLWESVASS